MTALLDRPVEFFRLESRPNSTASLAMVFGLQPDTKSVQVTQPIERRPVPVDTVGRAPFVAPQRPFTLVELGADGRIIDSHRFAGA